VIPALEARTSFVEIRLASQLITPPTRPTIPDYWQGPATPPVVGVEIVLNRLPKNSNRQWLLDVAWSWRNRHVVPEELTPVVVPDQASLQRMEKVAPNVAAIYRQQIADAIACNRRMKPTRVIARLQRLIIDQYGWPDRD